MNFTYNGYLHLLSLLQAHGYKFADYYNWNQKKRCVIIRHDIDNDIEKALELAHLEYELGE